MEGSVPIKGKRNTTPDQCQLWQSSLNGRFPVGCKALAERDKLGVLYLPGKKDNKSRGARIWESDCGLP